LIISVERNGTVGASCWWSRSTGTGKRGLITPGLSNLVGGDRGFIMMRLSDYVVSGLHDKLGTLRIARLLLAEYLRHHHKGVSSS